MSISDTAIRNSWFGFYHPTVEIPSLAPQGKAALARSLSVPLTEAEQVAEVFDRLGAVSPSFHGVMEHFHKSGFSFFLSLQAKEVAIGTINREPYLVFPYDEPLLAHLSPFLIHCGSLRPWPEGVAVVPPPSGSNKSEIIKSLEEAYLWDIAVTMSFLYQVSLELHAAGIRLTQPFPRQGFLGATDLALFLILRESGLKGIYAGCRRFLPMNEIQASFERRADELIAGGGVTATRQEWSPEPLRDRPEWTRTFLDEEAEASERHRFALYTRGTPTSASSVDFAQVRSMMNRPLQSTEDVQTLLEAMGGMAPDLVGRILTPDIQRKVRFRVTTDSLPRSVALIDDFSPYVNGTPFSDPEIVIRRGTIGKNAMQPLIVVLGRLSTPEGFYGQIHFPRDLDVDQLTSFLVQQYMKQETWGQSAWLQFVHEASGRGHRGITLEDNHREMAQVLSECGFSVLVEQWRRFSSDEAEEIMRAAFATDAPALLRDIQQRRRRERGR